MTSGEWVPEFEGQRPPFEPGHELSLKHGAYAPLKLAPRAEEIAAGIRDQLEEDRLYAPAFELAIARLALVWARIENASAALDKLEGMALEPATPYLTAAAELRDGHRAMRDDLKGWLRLAGQIEASLGLTTESRAKLGLDLALTGMAVTKTKREALVERYRAAGKSGGDAA